jgi:hypothetical protein
MRIRLPLAFVLLCCCVVTTAPAQNGADPLTKKVDQLFATWDKHDSRLTRVSMRLRRQM